MSPVGFGRDGRPPERRVEIAEDFIDIRRRAIESNDHVSRQRFRRRRTNSVRSPKPPLQTLANRPVADQTIVTQPNAIASRMYDLPCR
jgi:hypothetical protein